MADDGRERRPFGQHAGEVTRKKNRYAANDGYGLVAEPPPPPTASQYGAARTPNSQVGQSSLDHSDDHPDENLVLAKPRKTPAEQRAKYEEYAEIRTKDSYHGSKHDFDAHGPLWPIYSYQSTPTAQHYSWSGLQPFNFSESLPAAGKSRPLMIPPKISATASKSSRIERSGPRPLPPTYTNTRATPQRVPGPQLAHSLPLHSHQRTTEVATKGTFSAKHQNWRRGRIEMWNREGLAIPVLSLTECPAFSVARATMRKMSPTWPASNSVPDGLMMYSSVKDSRKYFDWRPFQASDSQICGIYLEDIAGPALYYVLELETLTESQTKETLAEGVTINAAPGYLMHAKSGKTFAFRSETSTPEVISPVPRSAKSDESEDEDEDESEDESENENVNL